MGPGEWIAFAAVALTVIGLLVVGVWRVGEIRTDTLVIKSELSHVGDHAKANGEGIKECRESIAEIKSQVTDHVRDCDKDREQIHKQISKLHPA